MKKYPLVDSVCGKKMSVIIFVIFKKCNFTEKHGFEGCSGLVEYLYLSHLFELKSSFSPWG
jgi:hypothetical protein